METITSTSMLEYIQDNGTRLAFNFTAAEQNLDVAALPNDTKVLDLEQFKPQRNRFRGKFATSSVEDFVNYTEAKADLGAECFVYPDDMTATAVLNLGSINAPGHADSLAKM